jgi:hypothetical protein
MNPQNKNSYFKKVLDFIITTTLLAAAFVLSYKYIAPEVRDYLVKKNPELISNIIPKESSKIENRGLRTPKISGGYEDIPKDILSEVVYKDVRFISTVKRPFAPEEIVLLERIIDSLPQKLFDYRPWAIISTAFDGSRITQINPEGVAFASGPYVFVSDITFEKKDAFDTGTFRGLLRILSHEFTHVAQFFETQSIPKEEIANYLETSDLVKDWILKTGWIKNGDEWELPKSELTTEYGRTNPVEDMADSVGNMISGDEYPISESRADWVLEWLDQDKESLYLGTLPISNTIKQRRLENNDYKLLDKYLDKDAITQDIINFQSTIPISDKDITRFYTDEFLKRGWKGSFKKNRIGEFVYENKFRANVEIDTNSLKVITVVVSVY